MYVCMYACMHECMHVCVRAWLVFGAFGVEARRRRTEYGHTPAKCSMPIVLRVNTLFIHPY